VVCQAGLERTCICLRYEPVSEFRAFGIFFYG
jgi:hypothetical protein